MSEKPAEGKWRVAILTNSYHVYDWYGMFVCNCEKKEQAQQIVREHNAMARVKEKISRVMLQSMSKPYVDAVTDIYSMLEEMEAV